MISQDLPDMDGRSGVRHFDSQRQSPQWVYPFDSRYNVALLIGWDLPKGMLPGQA